MAATIHVTRTKGVRLPGYSLLPPPMGIPTAGIVYLVILKEEE
jgi:hypothetical protein